MYEKRPYVCPVCYGRGMVMNGFYSTFTGEWATTTLAGEICRTCNGSGIVWPNTNEEDIPKFEIIIKV